MAVLRVLGVDPGFGRTGLGVVDVTGSETAYVWHSVIETSSDEEFVDRIVTVRNDLLEAIRRFKPQVASVESLFFQSNAKTAMKVGMARGVILLTLADANLPIIEITPNQVKQGIAGWGNADKKQVQAMVQRLLRLPSLPQDDAADALALAIVGGLVHRTVSRRDLR
jgi:crossover junction endodeoxyribonuclease RuvC